MHWRHVRLVAVVAALGLVSTAQAGFINGGFEEGNFNGWTVEWKYTSSATWTSGLGPPGDIHQAVIGAVNDPYSPFDTPFNGNYMARLNRIEATYEMSRIRQTATMGAGEDSVFINWGAVLQDPGHSPSDQPFFEIEVKVNGSQAYYFQHTAGAGGNAGWTSSGSAGAWYKAGVASLTNLSAGASVEVILTVADCDLGGHWGYAYLDGIGTVQEQPPPGVPGVPDAGATALMLITALVGLAAFRRKT